MSAASRLAERLARLPLFVAADYLRANPDVSAAGADPSSHAATWGFLERRPVVSEIAAARAYARARDAGIAPPPAAAGGGLPDRCTVFVHSASDEGYRALAASLAADLGELGICAALSDERADHRADHGLALFVAPQDFFALGLGPLWRDPEVLGRGFVVLDDAVGTPAFDGALGFALEARGVIDTSAVGAAVWTETGVPNARLVPRVPLRARWLRPGDLADPLMRAAPAGARRPVGEPLGAGERSLDLLFFAPETPRRNAALGRLAPALSRHRCYVYPQQAARTAIEERVYRRAHWRIAGHLAGHARLFLSLSDGALPVLDRRRVVEQAMAGGAVVVSDVAFVEPGLEAGAHYMAAEARHLGDMIDWALRDPSGREEVDRVRERAFDRVAAVNGDRGRLDGLRGLLAGPSEEGSR